MNKEFYQNRIGIFPIFWGSRRKDRDLFFFTSQVESAENKKKPTIFPLHRFPPLYRSFSVSSGQDKRDYKSIKEKKTVSDNKKTKNSQIQSNKKNSNLFGLEKPTSHVVKKVAHNREITKGKVEKKQQGNWSQKKKGVSDNREYNNNLSRDIKKKSSLFGFEKTIPNVLLTNTPPRNQEPQGENLKAGRKGNWSLERKGVWDKKESKINHFPRDGEESSVEFKVIGVDKAADGREVTDENVKKRKEPTFNSHVVGVEKAAQKRRIKGGNVQKKKNDFTSREKKLAYRKLSQAESLGESKKPGNQSHIKDQNLQRKNKKFQNAPDHRKQMKASNVKGNEKNFHDNRKFNKPCKQPEWLHNWANDKYISVDRRLKEQMKLKVQTVFDKQVTSVPGFFPAIHSAIEKKITQVKRCFDIQQRLSSQTDLAVAALPSKKSIKSDYNYIVTVNNWLGEKVKFSDKLQNKGIKILHKNSPESQSLHRVVDKNLTKKSKLQRRSHQPYFKFLLERTPQASSNYKIICRVNKTWFLAEKIARKTQKLLQQQDKKIKDLETKVVNFYKETNPVTLYNWKEIAKAKKDESKFILKFRNMLMRDGKKSKAHTTLFKSLKLFRTYLESMSVREELIEKWAETENNHYIMHCLEQAVENVKPSLEVRRKKISGIIRQIPAVPSDTRQQSVSIRWIIDSARKRKKKSSKPFFHCLAEEFLDAYKNQGEAYKKKQALHNTAEASRIYIRYRWW